MSFCLTTKRDCLNINQIISLWFLFYQSFIYNTFAFVSIFLNVQIACVFVECIREIVFYHQYNCNQYSLLDKYSHVNKNVPLDLFISLDILFCHLFIHINLCSRFNVFLAYVQKSCQIDMNKRDIVFLLLIVIVHILCSNTAYAVSEWSFERRNLKREFDWDGRKLKRK